MSASSDRYSSLARRAGGIRVKVLAYGKDEPRFECPPRQRVQTACEWNKIAPRNNRVEIAVLPSAR